MTAVASWTGSCAAGPERAPVADLVIYGATSGGIAAAVQGARDGLDVVLLEPGRHIGGLTAGGLGATDIGNKAAIGGLSREFYRRVREHYADPASWTRERAEDFGGRGHRPGEDAAWTFEPHVAEELFAAMLAEAGVHVQCGAGLDLDAGARMEGTRIVALRLMGGEEVRGRVFVDATYEGDLMAAAGVGYHVGREANEVYGETLNGVQVAHAVHHQFSHEPDPYVVPGVPESGLLFGIEASPPGPDGRGDDGVQAYCFRLCTTNDPANRLPWPKPDGYREADYELLLRNFEAGDRRRPWHPVWMPNRKTDTNNNFAFSTDFIDGNRGWAEGSWGDREQIFDAHRRYQQGLIWTLANHPRVPQSVREHFAAFGLCRDEFVATGGWPHQLYVREARRMVGAMVMTEHHCRGTEIVDDPVGLAAYTMDSHNVHRYVDAQGRVRNEGDVQVGGFDPYPISYRAIVPRAEQCTNLLVPVALSASHIAYGSIRMEPVFMILGQSAAVAAALALDGSRDRPEPIQQVSYALLRARLLSLGQVLEWRPVARAAASGVPPGSIAGVVVDDAQARVVGGWQHSVSTSPFVGQGYRHDRNAAKGEASVTFALTVPQAGGWRLELAWPAHANRASEVPWRVLGTDHQGSIDQRQAPSDGLWQPLCELALASGETVSLRVSNRDTEGYVVADAARLVPVGR